MRRLHFGCGEHRISGWENYDIELDITKTLPFPENTARYIFTEHVVEHLTSKEAWNFFVECARVLVPEDGTLRIAVPVLERIARRTTKEYLHFLRDHGWGDASWSSAIQNIVANHGHRTFWSVEQMRIILHAVGFGDVKEVGIGDSDDPSLRNLEGHGLVISDEFNDIETCVVEAKAPPSEATPNLLD